MDTWENKAIAEKLDSLGNLPDGYTPNLSSKWDIIQSSLGKHPKTNLFKRILPGILFLLIAFLTVWVWNPQPESNVTAISKALPSPVVSPDIKEFAVHEAIAPKKLRPEKKKVAKMELPVNPPVEKMKAVDIPPSVIQGVIAKPDTLQLQPGDTLKITVPVALKTKQIKKVYQRDFNGIINVADPSHEKTAQKSFQIKLGLQSNKDVSTGQPPSLRLTQNF